MLSTGDSSSLNRVCMSPASRIRIAADVHRHSTSDDDSGCVLEEYAWVPSGIKPDMVHLYFACLPEDKIPYVGSLGEKWRCRQLSYQLPPQDSDMRYCSQLSEDEAIELAVFEKQRKRDCLGRGEICRIPCDDRKRNCQQCKQWLCEDEIAVCGGGRFSGDGVDNDVFWHPHCFVCSHCLQLLVDLIFYRLGSEVFCGRHHAERLKPRCAKCDELIFSDECTEAEGRAWHMRHFSCVRCDRQLGGHRYIVNKDQAICIECYESKFAENSSCIACQLPIAADQPHITQADHQWHADEQCFRCTMCQRNLLGKRNMFRNGRLFCGMDCLARSMTPNHRPVAAAAIANRGTAIPPFATPPPPPPRSPSPIENIYETVLPCSSSRDNKIEQQLSDQHFQDRRNKHHRGRRHSRSFPARHERRALSAEMRHRMAMISFGEQCSSRSSAKKMTNKDEEEHLKKMQNFYSRMPPPDVAPLPPPPRRLNRNERRCSSSSDSDPDDMFFADYQLVLPRTAPPQDSCRPIASFHRRHPHNHRIPVVTAPRTAKKSPANNCIVS